MTLRSYQRPDRRELRSLLSLLAGDRCPRNHPASRRRDPPRPRKGHRPLRVERGGQGSLSDLAAPPLTLSPETSISTALDEFQDANQELALVVDSEVVGLLTATDAMEAITGELADPMDPVEERPAA